MTTTTYLEWEDQATGANNNSWGDQADSNWTIMELAIARYVSIATTGGTTVLTTAQNRYPTIIITGTLVSNAIIQVRTAEKNWRFLNLTAGNYTVEVKTSGGTGKKIPRYQAVKLYCDGTNVEYLRDAGIPHAQAGGTVDAITATFEPATVANDLYDGFLWAVEAAGANTSTTPTFTPDGLSAKTIKKNGAQALAVGDIPRAGYKCLFMYDLSGGHVELLNPATLQAATETAAGAVELATTAEAETGTDTARAVTPAGVKAAVTGEQTVNLLAVGMIKRTTNGPETYSTEKATNDVMVSGFAFDKDTEEALQIMFPMPKSYGGGDLYFTPAWTTAAVAGTGDVIWGVRARFIRNDDAIDAAFGTAAEVTDSFLADGDMHIAPETAAVTPGGTFASQCWLVVEVYRKAAAGGDTYTQDAILLGLAMTYPTTAMTDD